MANVEEAYGDKLNQGGIHFREPLISIFDGEIVRWKSKW